MVDYIYLEEDLGWEKKSFEDLFEIGCLADKYDVAGMIDRGEYFYFYCRKPPRNENGLAADFGRKMAESHVIFRYF